MWQTLSSKDNRENLKNAFMLPFEGRSLVFSYVAALGAYTLLTKTAGLLAVVWAVSRWNWTEILGSILCSLLAVVAASCLYPLRLGRTDAYAFYVQSAGRGRTAKLHRHHSLWRYLFRYLMAHKNYLFNTVILHPDPVRHRPGLERKGQYSPTEHVQLAVGLPPEHYGSLKEKFAAYFKRSGWMNRKRIIFS